MARKGTLTSVLALTEGEEALWLGVNELMFSLVSSPARAFKNASIHFFYKLDVALFLVFSFYCLGQ